MCDTIIAVSSATADDSIIFGKNSDRDPNEVQNLIHLPRRKQESDLVKATYIELPQVKETFEIFLSQPFWMFGAEMGANEYNVVIGNEAVYTKEKLEKKALLGMDMLRLALERSKTAQEAIDTIVGLLTVYGQGGECGYTRHATYHNSFIIADPNEAWVLETAGRYWIAEKVTSIRTISNCLTIGNEYDKIHPELIEHAINKGYCKDDSDFHFANNFHSKFMTWAARGDTRRACTLNILSANHGNLRETDFMNALRSHNLSSRKKFNPARSSMSMPCVHASSFQTPSQSTASQISVINNDKTIHWFTGTSGTCTSVFKPFFLGVQQYKTETYTGSATFSQQSLWWKHELLHRLTLKNYAKLHPIYTHERDMLEKKIILDVNRPDQSNEDLFSQSNQIFDKMLEKETEWYNKVKVEFKKLKKISLNPYTLKYNNYWKKWNKKAKLQH